MSKQYAEISLVIPVYNESENLHPLYKNCSSSLTGEKVEILFVDDGSSDNSVQVLEEISKQDPSVKVIELGRNFGQTTAISAGLEYASGGIIVLMDGDLQNDPKDIPRLVQLVRNGCDLASGWRKGRKDPFFSRRLPSLVANWIIRRISGVPLHDFGCTLKAYRSSFLKDVKLYGEMHRLIPLYVFWKGAKLAELEVNHSPRIFGKSHYGFSRIYKVFLDLLTAQFIGNYISRPSHFIGGAGLALTGAGTACGAFVLLEKYAFGIWVHRNPLIWLAIFLFLLGSQLLSLGLLSEIIMRSYFHTSGEKPYSIKKRINFG